MADKNTSAVRGGPNLLINPFSVYIVNPAKFSTHPMPNVAAAPRFADFLVSPGFQQALAELPDRGRPGVPAGRVPGADARLAAAADGRSAGDTVRSTATRKNRLPGGGQITGLPIQLQQSTDDGTTWKSIGGPVNTLDGWQVHDHRRRPHQRRYRRTTPAFAASHVQPVQRLAHRSSAWWRSVDAPPPRRDAGVDRSPQPPEPSPTVTRRRRSPPPKVTLARRQHSPCASSASR